MKLKDIIGGLRVILDDVAKPYLWQDDKLTAYLNEAQVEACIRARLIPDKDSIITKVTVAANENEVELDPLITHVQRVYGLISGERRSLSRTSIETLDAEYDGRWPSCKGQPRFFYDEIDYLGVHPTPTVNTSLMLAVYRLPLEPMDAADDEPEIPERFQIHLIEWAAHLCFMRRDSDSQDKPRANDHEARFTAIFGERPTANHQRTRRLKKVPVCKPIW
ncbi:MAG: hypothetical protein V4607_02050 [Pseudomonadota bacterium]